MLPERGRSEACFRNIIHSISPVFYFDAKVAGNGHNVRNDSTEDCDGFTDDDRIKEVKQEKGMPMVSFYFRLHIRNCFWVYRICRGNAKQVVLGLEHLHLP